MKKIPIFELFDYALLLCTLCLITVGIFFIYSSGVNSDGISVSNEYIRQIMFAVSGIVIMLFVAIFDYRKIQRFVPQAFFVFLAVLLYVLFFGRSANGARSWIGIGTLGVQPSELGKIIYILFLAWYLERSEKTLPIKRFIISAAIMFLPIIFILPQPDMGTASVYVPIFLIMIFAAGLPLKYIILVTATSLLTIVFTILPVVQ
ncbi:MAG: FtsW/RodA/SpoVE family cell cycle protein, partial [Spirochaetales bacterium]